MAKSNDTKQVDVGFIAGQVLTLKLAASDYDGLVKALLGEGGWQEVQAEDAHFVLDTNKVAYVRVASEEHSVGFAGNSE